MISKTKKKEKGAWQNVFFSVVLGILILVVVGYLIMSNWKMNQRRTDLNEQVRVLQEQLNVLQTKKQSLESQILQTGGEDYLEKEARETFNLKKPGEEVVAVLPPEKESGNIGERSFWQKIWDKIGF
ncbi:MAG: septum formation initiator family protein [Candidatus Nealsonbacteria bacterium]|nr:septum formation initiator family protein [Candidatus Nealsonbacteria bacterium]